MCVGDRGTITIDGKEMTIIKNEPASPGDPTQFTTMTAKKPKQLDLHADSNQNKASDQFISSLTSDYTKKQEDETNFHGLIIIFSVFAALREVY